MLIKKISKQTVITESEVYVANIEIKNGWFSKITKLNIKPNLNNILMPGFIDIHTHGGYGFSFNDLSNKKIPINQFKKYLKNITNEGVTSVFGTTVTCSITDLKNIYSSLLFIKNLDKNQIIKGWHIEGPFISPSKSGAHDKQYIIELNDQNVEILQSFKNINKILTIAPEYKDNVKYIKSLSQINTISLGHTQANANQTNRAIQNGAKHFTHLFNSMPKFEHRNPTVINEAINDKHTYCELICDLIHIEQLTIKNIYQSIGCNRIILITDTLSCKGLKKGRYMLGSMPINKHNHIATMLDNKSIAGSIQPYIQQLKNFYNTTKCSFNDLVKISSYNAAKSLKLNNIGEIKVGYKANFVILDNKINLKHTYIDGKEIY